MKKNIIYIIAIIFFQSCISLKQQDITIYGKIKKGYIKGGELVYSENIGYKINKVESWPDSLQNEYVKISGVLEIKEFKISDKKQMYSAEYLIKKPEIERVINDSIIAMIDRSNGDCVEMKRFIKLIQKEKMLDSITSIDSIVFLLDKSRIETLARYHYETTGSKSVHFVNENYISYFNIEEYFVITNFPCNMNSKYDFDIIFIKKTIRNRLEEIYNVKGNNKRVFIERVR